MHAYIHIYKHTYIHRYMIMYTHILHIQVHKYIYSYCEHNTGLNIINLQIIFIIDTYTARNEIHKHTFMLSIIYYCIIVSITVCGALAIFSSRYYEHGRADQPRQVQIISGSWCAPVSELHRYLNAPRVRTTVNSRVGAVFRVVWYTSAIQKCVCKEYAQTSQRCADQLFLFKYNFLRLVLLCCLLLHNLSINHGGRYLVVIFFTLSTFILIILLIKYTETIEIF